MSSQNDVKLEAEGEDEEMKEPISGSSMTLTNKNSLI